MRAEKGAFKVARANRSSKPNRERILILLLLLALTTCIPLWAFDLGIGETEEGEEALEEEKPQPVQIMKQPVSVKRVANYQIFPIVDGLSLKPDEEYQSDFLDVRGFSSVTFFVFPLTSSTIVDSQDHEMNYQLDAFFTLDDPAASLDTAQDKKSLLINSRQEFGSVLVKNGGDNPTFIKLSTGSTPSMALYTRVYGPYVCVVLKNTTKERLGKFRIGAYASET